jgi:hypothetical protein
MNLDKKVWAEGLKPTDYDKQTTHSCETLEVSAPPPTHLAFPHLWQ